MAEKRGRKVETDQSNTDYVRLECGLQNGILRERYLENEARVGGRVRRLELGDLLNVCSRARGAASPSASRSVVETY